MSAPLTATTSTSDGTSDGTDRTSGGRIDRVNAFDGLFLRSEHLTRMQDYARELVTALGAAGGPGVVWGYGLSVEGNELRVAPGLAVDAVGRPLRADREMTLDLTQVQLSANQYAVIWIARKTWPFGQEAVQGVLCEDPCSGGGSGRPYQAEGVVAGRTDLVEGGLVGESSEDRRSWLASRLFALEGTGADAWPERGGDGVLDRSWAPFAAPASLSDEVPIGVLLPGDDGWVLDTWSVRRARDVTPSRVGWEWQLGMRPWPVFVAQMLQFLDQLGELYGAGSPVSRASATESLIGRIEDISGRIMQSNRKITMNRIGELLQEVRQGELGARVAGAGLVPLRSLGIGELPPAGFLPAFGVTSREGAAAAVRELLGGAADVRACSGRIGDVGGFIARAQHRERISLANKANDAVVDVLWVEDAKADWVAFARREQIDCGAAAGSPQTEPVQVYVLDSEIEEGPYFRWVRYLEAPRGEHPDLVGDPVELQYPVRTWALPEQSEYADLSRRLAEYAGARELRLVAVVTDDVRRPLGVGRALMLGLQCTEQESESIDTVSTVGPVEAIVVLVGSGLG